MDFEKQWKDICQIHLITKHYLLLAEEFALDGAVFLQPLKEHRDAYDHIIRVYAVQSGICTMDDSKTYMNKNMSKALGHEYRAFFDTADWLTMICRERINMLLVGKARCDIENVYPNYPQLKEMLLEIPDEIAELRENKDIGRSKESFLKIVNDYTNVIDKLILQYKELEKALNCK